MADQQTRSDRQQSVGVVGLGRVGLATAIAFASNGWNTIGVDTDPEIIAAIHADKSPAPNIDASEMEGLLTQSLSVSTNYASLSACEAILICVPANTKQNRLAEASRSLAGVLRAGQTVVVTSTVAPGATVREVRVLLEESGLVAGIDFHLGYSPERYNPGPKNENDTNNIRLVSGLTPLCASLCSEIIGSVWQTQLVSSIPAAETAKVLENTFRAVNIALANEFMWFCIRHGIEPSSVFVAAATKDFGYLPFHPSVWVGGHCIDVAPGYLQIADARLQTDSALLSSLASEINSKNVLRIADLVERFLDTSASDDVHVVLLLGTSYKPNIADDANSPAGQLLRLLDAHGIQVLIHDPGLPELRIDGRLYVVEADLVTALETADLTVVVQHHDEYTPEVLSHARRLYDPTALIRSSRDVLESGLHNGIETGDER